MFAYELLPRLIFLTLTVNNNAEEWEDRLEFIGTEAQWKKVDALTEQLACLE